MVCVNYFSVILLLNFIHLTIYKDMPARICVFDNIKFLLIAFVIYGHLWEIGFDIPKSLYGIIYSFHMPMFIMVTGYFSSRRAHSTKFWKSILNLGVLYLLFSVVNMLVRVVVYNKPPIRSEFIPPFALWYILSMICWRILLRYIPERLLKSWIFFAVTMCVSILPCFVMLNYFSLARTIAFFPYFLLGWLCKEYQWIDKINNINRNFKILIVLSCIPLCYIVTTMPLHIFWGCYPMNYTVQQILVYKVLAWIIALTIAISIYIVMPKKIAIKEGQYTLFYYLYHTIMIYPVFDCLMNLTTRSFAMSFVALIGIMVSLYLLRKIQFFNNVLTIIK